MTDEKKDTKALTVAGTALTGPLEERTRAFQQMGAAAALGLYPPGYDTPNKVVSAAWMADALGVHPGTYMAGVSVGEKHGKVLLFPKWEFEHGLLKSRLPGYKMTVLENTDDAAEIEMTDGTDTQRVRFTMDDAKRMKINLQKDGSIDDYWMRNRKDHLFAKAFHRCADRIGAHVLGGLPAMALAGDYNSQPEIVPTQSNSSAVVIEDDLGKDMKIPGAKLGNEPPPDPRVLLSPEIERVYGKKLPVKDRLEKLSLLLTAALRDELPSNTQIPEFHFKSLGEIGPVDAERILKFTQKKWPAEKHAALKEAIERSEKDADELIAVAPAAEATTAAEDALTPLEVYVEPPAQRSGDVDWTEFVSLVTQAKRDGRDFIKEAPKGSGRWWFVDKPILDARGATAAVCLYRDGSAIEPLGWYADRLRELLPKEMR